MPDIKISLVQTEIIWEKPDSNLLNLEEKLAVLQGKTDLIILPEMFNTGFTMKPALCAETADGKTVRWMKMLAGKLDCCITGSLIIIDNNEFFNRLMFVKPDGSCSHYNKRHLFRFAEENLHYHQGSDKVIIEIKGWKILPLICYDLRFPVWSKNSYSEKSGYTYDFLIYIANWPKKRTNIWKALLTARAIENLAYVAGVNRTGEDGNAVEYSGNTALINYKGDHIYSMPDDSECIETIRLSYAELADFRAKFNVGQDWDKFHILT